MRTLNVSFQLLFLIPSFYCLNSTIVSLNWALSATLDSFAPLSQQAVHLSNPQSWLTYSICHLCQCFWEIGHLCRGTKSLQVSSVTNSSSIPLFFLVEQYYSLLFYTPERGENCLNIQPKLADLFFTLTFLLQCWNTGQIPDFSSIKRPVKSAATQKLFQQISQALVCEQVMFTRFYLN